MKKYIFVCFAFLSQVFIQAQTENFKSDFDLEKLDEMVKEETIKARKEIIERDGVDGPWMVRLLVDYQKGVKVTEEDLNRIWRIYENTLSPRVNDKLYAFSLICELEDISKWEKEFDSLALSEDPKFIKTAIETMIWKLDRGTRKEKLILSNKPVILDRLVGFAKNNRADTTIHREAVKINEIAKPYIGENISRDVRRPDKDISEPTSGDKRIPEKISSDSSSDELFKLNVTSIKVIVTAAIISTFIIAVLIRRSNSK